MNSSSACPSRQCKPTGSGELCGCIFSADPGRTFPRGTGRCSRSCARTCTRPTWTPSAAAIPPPARPRQWELLRLLAAGHTNTQIARRLGISEGTVRSHLENIYERLHVSNRTAAVTRAFPNRVA